MRWAATTAIHIWSEQNSRSIPIPWRKMSRVLKPKGGNTGVIIAAPGVGKTTFALNWMHKSKVRCLFISSDTSPQDITVQLASLSTGEKRADVERNLMENVDARVRYAAAILEANPNLVLDFSPRPTTYQIRDRALALSELWGEPPHVIVMDTASNVHMTSMGENAEWQRVWLECIQTARDLNCFFLFTHHVRQGASRNGRLRPELNDGLWGSDQFPEFVIGLHQSQVGMVEATVLKNRSGPKDVPIKFKAQLAIADMEELDVGATS